MATEDSPTTPHQAALIRGSRRTWRLGCARPSSKRVLALERSRVDERRSMPPSSRNSAGSVGRSVAPWVEPRISKQMHRGAGGGEGQSFPTFLKRRKRVRRKKVASIAPAFARMLADRHDAPCVLLSRERALGAEEAANCGGGGADGSGVNCRCSHPGRVGAIRSLSSASSRNSH